MTRRWRGRAVRRWSERSLRRLHGSGVGRTAVAVADRCLRLAVECLLQFAEPGRIDGAAVDRQHDVAGLQAGLPEQRVVADRSDEHTSELQSLMRIPYAVFCLKKKQNPYSTPVDESVDLADELCDEYNSDTHYPHRSGTPSLE